MNGHYEKTTGLEKTRVKVKVRLRVPLDIGACVTLSLSFVKDLNSSQTSLLRVLVASVTSSLVFVKDLRLLKRRCCSVNACGDSRLF